jgi:hypothetical protein
MRMKSRAAKAENPETTRKGKFQPENLTRYPVRTEAIAPPE